MLVMEMSSKMKKNPSIRFNGFTDTWEQRKFKDVIISIQTGTNLLGAESNHGTPLIKMGNIQRGFFSFKKVEFLNENEQVEEKNMINFGDFLFNTRNTLDLVGKGATWFGKNDEYAFNSNIARFTFEGINTIFFNYLYNTPQMIKQVQARAVGTTSVAAVYPKDLNSIKFWIPSANEQQKIGALFKQIDDTIALHQRQLDNFKELKKAMLQKMFPQNGEKVPEVRFEGFTEGWEQRKLGEWIVPYAEKTNRNNQYPVLTSSRRGIFLQTDYYNGNQIASEDNTGYNIVPRGYFTYRHMSDDEIFKFNINDIVDYGIVSTLYPVFTTKQGLDSDFLQYQLNNGGEFRSYATLQKQGGSRTYMYLSKLENLKLTIPELQEQIKISNFFNQLDQSINLHQQKVNDYQQIKKAMLQKMFV